MNDLTNDEILNQNYQNFCASLMQVTERSRVIGLLNMERDDKNRQTVIDRLRSRIRQLATIEANDEINRL